MKRTPAITAYHSRAESLYGIVEVAVALGREPQLDAMLQRHGFSRGLLADPESRISFNALCQLHEDCAAEWDCADFGLRLARIQNLNILGPVGLVARLSDNVGAALKALADRMSIHSTGYTASLDEGDSAKGRPASISFLPRPGSQSGRQIQELSLGIARNILVIATGQADFRPLRVDFQHPPPADPEPARQFFAAPVNYARPGNTLYFDPALLALPTAIRDTAYAPIINAYLEQIRPSVEKDILASTRQLIGKLLATGRCSREHVADCLHLHPRTFQRRLSDAGVTFNQLLDDYRKTLAMDLLTQQDLPLIQVADVLGYADQSTFNQAFRRWTSSTPMKFRAAQTAR
ncbi:AraC family transcriptional regulator [Pseudomonas sp. N040]|uniref:AraC family transcriptional regulator n=1 Tax=Pseudomonas sp. N040 TaxID=2785325 RepID=UPI0018A320D1|nr:AraC family transcriptional regulator [Pseudomonas sp. N040]MBF7729107.1 AraC family transcriptional regulator [Pseudomonas sp. N040]MBW7012747.1 AraC family transcriptional regulator [Pseudomonas sp. N040]